MKVFVTVGAQMPFDRLIEQMDAWAGSHPEHNVVAQIGKSTMTPQHMESSTLMAPAQFEACCDEADAIVGHAGIGTLFAALERGKPIVVLPREATRRETRNEHQSATARRFAEYAGVRVAWGEDELDGCMAELPAMIERAGTAEIDARAGGALIRAIADFIDSD